MNYQKGYVTLILVLCVSTVAVLLVATLFDRSVRVSQSIIQQQENTRARVYAESCIDYALDGIATHRQPPCPPGVPACTTPVNIIPMTGVYQFQNGTCTFEISGNDPNFTIDSEGTSGRVTLQNRVTTNTIYPVTILSSYQEI